METDSPRPRKRNWILAAVFLGALAVIVAGGVSAYSLSNAAHASLPLKCQVTSAETVSTSGGNELLSSFPVACISIASPSNGTIIFQGAVYVANTQAQQQEGFMNVTSFGNCNGVAVNGVHCVGMIFNFTFSGDQCFWMHDTEIPLQQDWIADNGTVVSIYQAQPENNSVICHFGKYVLETSPGALIPLKSSVTIYS